MVLKDGLLLDVGIDQCIQAVNPQDSIMIYLKYNLMNFNIHMCLINSVSDLIKLMNKVLNMYFYKFIFLNYRKDI